MVSELLFDFPQHRRAHVWLADAPARFAGARIRSRTIEQAVCVPNVRAFAAVEVRVAHDPSSYALLGGELVRADVAGLEVAVSIKEDGDSFRSDLTPTSDEIKTGLLEEYADAVFSGVQTVAGESGVPSGSSLQFRWAAHGRVGSSPLAFETAARIVTQLLITARDGSTEQIRSVVAEELRRHRL